MPVIRCYPRRASSLLQLEAFNEPFHLNKLRVNRAVKKTPRHGLSSYKRQEEEEGGAGEVAGGNCLRKYMHKYTLTAKCKSVGYARRYLLLLLLHFVSFFHFLLKRCPQRKSDSFRFPFHCVFFCSQLPLRFLYSIKAKRI